MPGPRRVEIKKQQRLFDDFFKIDEVIASHSRRDGSMSPDERRLVFERGDAAAVLLFNPETISVVVVDQFRLPTLVARRRDNPATTNGWLTEAVAGMIDRDESAEDTVIRETLEETGYKIHDPKLVCKFFASPGGTSERIFLYFAHISQAAKPGNGGGVDGEDVGVVEMPLTDLMDHLRRGLIEDPKLAIAAYWFQDYLKEPLGRSSVRFAFKDRANVVIGYKTGNIDQHKDVDIWVNSENTDMRMDRESGRSISAKIRYLGANKDEDSGFYEDVIQSQLRSAMGKRRHVKIGTVFATDSGMLLVSHKVQKVLHVATVEGRPGKGFKAVPDELKTCVEAVLQKVDDLNRPGWLPIGKQKLESILMPMMGSGDGGLSTVDVAESLIPAAIEYIRNNQDTTLKQIYFLAFRPLDRSACDKVFNRYCTDGILARSP